MASDGVILHLAGHGYTVPQISKKLKYVQDTNSYGRTCFRQVIPWVSSIVYHRLDLRMQTILVRLYENSVYQGCCYFGTTGEKIILNGHSN